ncbi:hypothetical protein KSF_042660 [Reticulibacter mediterranei]|uniref:Uncharacterized protein n=1 Tax=Reticulibacter mediterranei TaxID=2778369 RepID=A0A8J3IIF5_9CHLR|nr:hypothetical protein KSF_042660 [Reticulibacter mediterranei]
MVLLSQLVLRLLALQEAVYGSVLQTMLRNTIQMELLQQTTADLQQTNMIRLDVNLIIVTGPFLVQIFQMVSPQCQLFKRIGSQVIPQEYSHLRKRPLLRE